MPFMPGQGKRQDAVVRARRGLARGPLLLAIGLALVAAWPIATALLGNPFAPPAPRLVLVPAGEDPTEGALYEVPEFALTNERGEAFGSAQLAGAPWVASFFFTSCPVICPKLTKRLQALQAEIEARGDGPKMVTFTVDPETDTPEVLAKHAREVGAKPERWTFLTGPEDALHATIVDGFKQAMGSPDKDSPQDESMAIAHGVRFVLVDGQGGVRGLYDTTDEGIHALLADAAAL